MGGPGELVATEHLGGGGEGKGWGGQGKGWGGGGRGRGAEQIFTRQQIINMAHP